MKIKEKIAPSQIACILVFNIAITSGLVYLTQSNFTTPVKAVESGYNYASEGNYNNSPATPVAISFSEFVNGNSSYNITKYYNQVKDSIGSEGNVRGDDYANKSYCTTDKPDFYLVKDTNGDLFNAAESEGKGGPATTAMLYNTYLLQYLVNCLGNYGAREAKITLPEGTFYFLNGHNKMTTDPTIINLLKEKQKGENYEQHVIKPTDNLYIKGRGYSKSTTQTVLKPYTSATYSTTVNAAAPDMFFFNDYSASWYLLKDRYLSNNRYEYFIIDGEKASGKAYTSSGKGFMYNLFKNTDWRYVTVRNTDGTGFGVDAPINSRIDNCIAEGCGKGLAWPNASSGASGFGIGTGIANNETFSITNSAAIGNRLFGIFFEHQNRFNGDKYEAVSGNFTVSNTTSKANWYNYGGYRAYDLTYGSNNKSIVGCTDLNRSLRNSKISVGFYKAPIQEGVNNYNRQCTKQSVYIDDNSRNVSITGIETTGTKSGNLYFADVKNDSYYKTAMDWAIDHSIIQGWVNPEEKFATGDEMDSLYAGVGEKLQRRDAVIYLWRYNNRSGKTVSTKNGNISSADSKQHYEKTCFTDVDPTAYYAPAVKWALENGVTKGISGNCNKENLNGSGVFGSTNANTTTRAEFITMLWRMKGQPSSNPGGDTRDFKDVTKTLDSGAESWYYDAVKWARSVGLTNGTGENEFTPNGECTREQAISILCRLDGYCKIEDSKNAIKALQSH